MSQLPNGDPTERYRNPDSQRETSGFPWEVHQTLDGSAPPAASPSSGHDWSAVEAQLREKAGGLYDPSDLEGIKRNTSYENNAMTLDQALANQYNIYGQRKASDGGGGGQQQAQGGGGATDGTMSWIQNWFQQQQSKAEAADAERKQRADSLYNTWLGRSQQALSVDRNDPIIRQQTDAYRAQEERSKRNYLGDLAESSGPLANLRGEQRMASERMGQRVGGMEAQLIGQELQTKRQEIAQALNAMGGLLSADQQANLQRELAALDAAIAQQGLSLQNKGLDQNWQQALLQNNQFMSRLGLDAENQYNYWNDPLRGV